MGVGVLEMLGLKRTNEIRSFSFKIFANFDVFSTSFWAKIFPFG